MNTNQFDNFKIVIIYLLDILLSTCIFIVLFHTSILNGINVFFYRGGIFLILASLLASTIMWVARYINKKLFSVRDIITVFFIFLGFTSSWFVLVPVTVERSISVYMLSYMAENSDHGITSEDFGNVFYDNYIVANGAFEKRFSEQLASHNIDYSSDGYGYEITENGRNVVKMFRICAYLFNTEEWLVYPNEYAPK